MLAGKGKTVAFDYVTKEDFALVPAFILWALEQQWPDL
jgi:hypothetical protein